MNKTRESCLAAILARGLVRVQQRAQRTGTWKSQGDDEPQLSAAEASAGDHPSVDAQAAAHEQGEPR